MRRIIIDSKSFVLIYKALVDYLVTINKAISGCL